LYVIFLVEDGFGVGFGVGGFAVVTGGFTEVTGGLTEVTGGLADVTGGGLKVTGSVVVFRVITDVAGGGGACVGKITVLDGEYNVWRFSTTLSIGAAATRLLRLLAPREEQKTKYLPRGQEKNDEKILNSHHDYSCLP
jgi:hypothetical protein